MYILPVPKTVIETEGTFKIKAKTSIAIRDGEDDHCLFVAKLLQEEIKSSLGISVPVTRTSESFNWAIVLKTDTKEGRQEDYKLEIGPNIICATGFGKPGLLYAIQSLRQLIREYGCNIPAMIIEDSPAIKNRGFITDVTRGRIPTLEYLKSLADECAFYKVNMMQFNLEHAYMFKNESEIWRDSDPLTSDEILELDRYCKNLCIDLVPCLASFGHLYQLLRSRTYKDLCELEVDVNEPFSLINRMRHHTIDVTNDESLALITSRIKEYMSLFSSKYFNICADETFDLGRGKSKDEAEKIGKRNLYIAFLKKLCDFVRDQGKTPMFWGDVVIENPEVLTELPEDAICMNWEYSPLVKEDNIKKLSEAKVKRVYVCPGVQGWQYLINNHHEAFLNISGMCNLAHKYQVEGVLNTDWGDLGHIAYPEFSMVGMIYGASLSWSDEEMTEDELNKRISKIRYFDSKEEFINASTTGHLAELEPVPWWPFVTFEEANRAGIEEVNFDIVMDESAAEAAGQKILEIQYIQDLLYDKLLDLGPQAKEAAMAYITMSEGQIAITRACLAIRSGLDKKTYHGAILPFDAAVALEKWFMTYKQLWRTVSKESELYHLAEIIFWYADFLRDLKGKE
ncbi:MAG: beta-N-acetylhexosaminidase [Pseudobutyrivibrio sp.]|nr:beta-N-acetylhexosaminidase [Pseudobutyrivibrio sp.]